MQDYLTDEERRQKKFYQERENSEMFFKYGIGTITVEKKNYIITIDPSIKYKYPLDK